MDSHQPFFTVIIPVYNRADFVVEAIQSVLNQTFTDFELICIDDGSADNSGELILQSASSDPRVKLISQTNQGRCSARNRGIDAAKGKWIAFLDSDDGYFSNHLEVIHGLIIANKNLAGFATEMVLGLKVKEYDEISAAKTETILELNDFVRSNPISLNQFCYSKEICPDLRFPDIDILASEDFLFMRMFCYRHKILKVNVITNYVNDHPLRSVNLIRAKDFVKWNTFTTDYFLKNYQLPGSVRNRMNSYILLFSANMLLSSHNKKDGIRKLVSSLRYSDTYANHLFYKALLKIFI